MPKRDWSRLEVEATVRDYLDMLAAELRGDEINKSAHNEALRKEPKLFLLPGDIERHVQLQAVNYRARL